MVLAREETGENVLEDQSKQLDGDKKTVGKQGNKAENCGAEQEFDW